MRAFLFALLYSFGMLAGTSFAADGSELDEGQKASIAELAGSPEDFELVYRVWRFGRVPPPKGEELATMQAEVFAVPDWQVRLWRRLAVLARAAELPPEVLTAWDEERARLVSHWNAAKERDERPARAKAEKALEEVDQRLFKLTQAQAKFHLLLSRVAWMRSEQVIPLIVPFLDSSSGQLSRGGVIYSGVHGAANAGVTILAIGKVLFEPPVPLHKPVREWEQWWVNYKASHKLPFVYDPAAPDGGAAAVRANFAPGKKQK